MAPHGLDSFQCLGAPLGHCARGLLAHFGVPVLCLYDGQQLDYLVMEFRLCGMFASVVCHVSIHYDFGRFGRSFHTQELFHGATTIIEFVGYFGRRQWTLQITSTTMEGKIGNIGNL